MRRLLTMLLEVVLCGAVWMAEGHGGESMLENGDTNGDGARDISDASYLLNWLFLGGPRPIDITVPQELLNRLDGLDSNAASNAFINHRSSIDIWKFVCLTPRKLPTDCNTHSQCSNRFLSSPVVSSTATESEHSSPEMAIPGL